MKAPRFIKEYANYKINCCKENELMKEEYKTEKIDKIHKALHLIEKSFITVDEAIKTINEV